MKFKKLLSFKKVNMAVRNYRPMRKRVEITDQKLIDAWIKSHWVYWLHEMHYRWNDDTKMRAYSVDSIIWYFSDVDDMIAELTLMLKDARKYRDEILEYDKSIRQNNKMQKIIRKILSK